MTSTLLYLSFLSVIITSLSSPNYNNNIRSTKTIIEQTKLNHSEPTLNYEVFASDTRLSVFDRRKIIKEFHANFPFLDETQEIEDSTINFIRFPEGNYTGQIKEVKFKKDDNRKYEEINTAPRTEMKQMLLENDKLGAFLREGWGKMSWANGTLYGDEGKGQFVYAQGDEYIGQWFDDTQNGKNCNYTTCFISFYFLNYLLLNIFSNRFGKSAQQDRCICWRMG